MREIEVDVNVEREGRHTAFLSTVPLESSGSPANLRNPLHQHQHHLLRQRTRVISKEGSDSLTSSFQCLNCRPLFFLERISILSLKLLTATPIPHDYFSHTQKRR